MAKARGSEDAFDALVTAMVMVEHRAGVCCAAKDGG